MVTKVSANGGAGEKLHTKYTIAMFSLSRFFFKHNCSKHSVQIDEGVPISGSEFLFEKSVTLSGDKVFRRLEGALHAVLSDPSAEEAMEHIVKFVDERLEKFVSK